MLKSMRECDARVLSNQAISDPRVYPDATETEHPGVFRKPAGSRVHGFSVLDDNR